MNLESLRQKAPRHRDPGGPISGFPDTTATVTLTESLLYCSGFVLDHAANGVARFRSSCNEHNSKILLSNKILSLTLNLAKTLCLVCDVSVALHSYAPDTGLALIN